MAEKIRNRYNQVPHLTHDTTWESDKNKIKHHKQEVSPFPAGDHKAAMCLASKCSNEYITEGELGLLAQY